MLKKENICKINILETDLKNATQHLDSKVTVYATIKWYNGEMVLHGMCTHGI